MVTKQFESGITPKIVSDYDVDNVSLKVSRIILSYIDYINSTVWKKDSFTRMTQMKILSYLNISIRRTWN